MSNPNHLSKAAVLQFWRAIELFSPQNIPHPARSSTTQEPVFVLEPNAPLPWQALHSLQKMPAPKQKVRRFMVYGGVFSLENMSRELEKKIGQDTGYRDDRPDGESCLFAFSVASDGRPLLNSFVLSTAAWAIGRVLKPGLDNPQWLDGFGDVSSEITLHFAQQFALAQDDMVGQAIQRSRPDINIGRPVLTHSDLSHLANFIAKKLGIPQFIGQPEIRVEVVNINAQFEYLPLEQDFLNSFFIGELEQLTSKVKMGQFGSAFNHYLTLPAELDITHRVDVRHSPAVLFEQLAPARFPAGRWPNANQHSLVLSQQLALNNMLENLGYNPGLFAVNGPPGTGKTTLLRDLIASVVVERAKLLAQLATPSDAFFDKELSKNTQYPSTTYLLQKQFLGFEIVVASNNNNAVENITLEIPGFKAVDESWAKTVNYFSEMGETLIGQRSWAMLATRLGNKKNRLQFIEQFIGMNEGNQAARSKKFMDYVQESINQNQPPTPWADAVKQFEEAAAEEQKYRQEQQKLYELRQQLTQTTAEIDQLTLQIEEWQQTAPQAQNSYDQLRQQETELNQQLFNLNQAQISRPQTRPGFMQILLSVGLAWRKWVKQEQEELRLMAELLQQLTALKTELTQQEQTLATLKTNIEQKTEQLQQKQLLCANLQTKIAQAKEQVGVFLPDVDAWASDEPGRETSAPWATPEWNEARTKLFLAALRLHKEFIKFNKDLITSTLATVRNLLFGNSYGLTPQAIQSAWATLFLLIPVVSSTFASFGRLFSTLGQESLGWLLIDEAGQATPQSAAGAIWRSKRVVVVGDPLQLEPVVTIPLTAQHALSKFFAVDELWMPSFTSAQHLADRAGRLGTYLEQQGNKLWIGSPLRVHRRCDRPMFEIVNQLAYDGLMISNTAPPDDEHKNLTPSQWIDVQSEVCEGHWIPAEGRATQILLDGLLSEGVQPQNLALISPFKVVGKQLKELVEQSRYKGIKVGTIHTMQGKEANIVILVLGGHSSQPGAKQWASARPNLLNVAVSRAKYRLFVIGNKTEWGRHPYFSLCLQHLSLHMLQEMSSSQDKTI